MVPLSLFSFACIPKVTAVSKFNADTNKPFFSMQIQDKKLTTFSESPFRLLSVCCMFACMRYEQCSKNLKYAVSSCDVPDTHPLVLIGIEICQEPFKYMMIHIYEVSPFMLTGVSYGHHLNASFSLKKKKKKDPIQLSSPTHLSKLRQESASELQLLSTCTAPTVSAVSVDVALWALYSVNTV